MSVYPPAPFRTARRLALLAAAALLVPGAAGASGWTLVQHDEDARYTLHSRPVAGSSYDEYRMQVVIDAEPDEVLAALRHNLLDPATYPPKLERVVLRREGRRTLVLHDTMSAPFIATRDAVVRVTEQRDPGTDAPLLRWTTTNDGPAPAEGVLRMPKYEGMWKLLRRDGGRTLAVYRSHVDFGGSLPSAFVEARLPAAITRQAVELRRTTHERTLVRR